MCTKTWKLATFFFQILYLLNSTSAKQNDRSHSNCNVSQPIDASLLGAIWMNNYQ